MDRSLQLQAQMLWYQQPLQRLMEAPRYTVKSPSAGITTPSSVYSVRERKIETQCDTIWRNSVDQTTHASLFEQPLTVFPNYLNAKYS